MFPTAPLFTSLYRAASTFPEFTRVDIRASFLDRLPVDSGFRNLLPLYPAAFATLGPVQADVLIASSSGWAHSLRVRPPGKVVVYCHNAPRWLYGDVYLGAGSARQRALGPLGPWLRRWDQAAARRADLSRRPPANGSGAPTASTRPSSTRRSTSNASPPLRAASDCSASRACRHTSVWISSSTPPPAPASGWTWWGGPRPERPSPARPAHCAVPWSSRRRDGHRTDGALPRRMPAGGGGRRDRPGRGAGRRQAGDRVRSRRRARDGRGRG
jgi:hypothetical protein